MASKIVSLILSFTLFFSAAAVAVTPTPTPQQIEQFKKLPADQQRALAKQFGVDLNAIGLEGSSNSSIPPPIVDTPTVTPRDAKTNVGVLEQRIQESGDLQQPGVTLREQTRERDVRQKLDQFGYELFAGAPSTFAPVTNIPIPSKYVVGPGDNVVVQLYGKENVSHEMVINRDGILQFPDVGPLTVAGLTFDEMKTLINDVVSQKKIGVNASVTMGALRSIQVFVLGDAYRPGAYTVSSLSTITNALFVSGGVTKIGSLRDVQLKRDGKVVSHLDLYDLLLKGDTTADMRLQPGDVIFIPPIGKSVAIKGEVRRPAIYEIKNETTVNQVIEIAGGFLPTAYPKASRIDRINSNGERVSLDVNLQKGSASSVLLRDGDVIQVFPVLNRVKRIVMLSGHVQRPGAMMWKPGMRLTDVIPSTDELLQDPDLNYGLIKREIRPGRTIQIIAFNPGKALTNPSSANDLLLQERDEILVFGRNNEERRKAVDQIIDVIESQAGAGAPAKIVSVLGKVRFPGDYPLTENMAVKDLLDASGGLLESAYQVTAELTRTHLDNDQKQRSQRIEIVFGGENWDKSTLNSKLVSRDQLYIKKIPGWDKKQYAEIQGEVNFPGQYPIYPGDTIGTLVARAGGLNEYADPNSTIFLRESLRQREQEQIEKFRQRLESDVARLKVEAAQSKALGSDAEKIGASLLSEIVTVKATGRLVVDVESVLHGDKDSDVILQDGDKIIFPRKPQEVSVVGEVQFPTSHLYKNGMSAFDYINLSGGFTPKSNESFVYVISANGQVKPAKQKHFWSKSDSLLPGDTVVVPYDVQSMSSMAYWASISQILFNLSTTAAVLKTVGAF